MTTYYVCKCGNPQTNHEFRHPFENTVKVIKKKVILKRTVEEFHIDAEDFPFSTKTKCSVPNCSALASLHGTIVIAHAYVPEEFKYRQIKLTIPLTAKCNNPDCGVSLEKHNSILTHSFATKVIITNKSSVDTVEIVHPDDEEIKIIWS